MSVRRTSTTGGSNCCRRRLLLLLLLLLFSLPAAALATARGDAAAAAVQRRRQQQQQSPVSSNDRDEWDERFVLMELFESTSGTGDNGWARSWGWTSPSTVFHCQWEGVRCERIPSDGSSGSSSSRSYLAVTELLLRENSMMGSVPDLSGLRHLSVLDLSGNELYTTASGAATAGGTLEDLGVPQLHRLRNLSLARNAAFGGPISGLAGLTSLVHLDLSWNGFELLFDGNNGDAGRKTTDNSIFQNLTSLRHVDLSKNRLRGSLADLGLSLNTAKNVSYLDLSNNNLTGPVDGLFLAAAAANSSNSSSLVHLDLSDNSLSGNLSNLLASPAANFSSLEYLSFSRNNLTWLGDRDASVAFANLTRVRTLLASENQLAGTFPYIGNMSLLERIDFSSSGLSGTINTKGFWNCSLLEAVLLADNDLSGPIPAISSGFVTHLDLSRNRLSSSLDVISNLTNLETLDLAENYLEGPIPPSFMSLPSLRYLNISHNNLNGRIQGDFAALVLLEHLDLSHNLMSTYDQAAGKRIESGISGTIPNDIGSLRSLQSLDLSSNLLSGSLPDTIARLEVVQTLDLQTNQLSGSIPSSFNYLEQLKVLALASNRLTGTIPELGGSVDVIRDVSLADNLALDAPAPFKLCDLENLDLREDRRYCPPERIALVEFFISTKGYDWNVNSGWLSADHHCTWFGIECDEDASRVIKIDLSRNGLSGPIGPDLFKLTSLESIDFNDNDLRGEVPPEIEKLSNLKRLRLSYNMLTSLPVTLANLTRLSFLHIHSNRISGNDTYISLAGSSDRSSCIQRGECKFIADCGDPTDSEEPFQCENCDMCCNSFDACQLPLEASYSSLNGLASAAVLIAGTLVFLLVFGALAWLLSQKFAFFHPSLTTNAKEACGDGSVYSFLIGDSYFGWAIAAGTAIGQVLIYGLFIDAASFSNEDSDFVYSWRCPRNSEYCNDDRSLGVYGWTVWVLLVATVLLDDFANSLKLLYLSATRLSIHSFCGCFILLAISVLAVYTSVVYNRAIATTDTELIINAVILLFLNEMDDQLHHAIVVIAPDWVDKVSKQADSRSTKLLRPDRKNRAVDNDLKLEIEDGSGRNSPTGGIDDVTGRNSPTGDELSILPAVSVMDEKVLKLESDLQQFQKTLELQQRVIDDLRRTA